MDFAKRIYGGPFETEKVEDVKTFLRIVTILFAITPSCILDVPTSHLFQYFGAHLGENALHGFCLYLESLQTLLL